MKIIIKKETNSNRWAYPGDMKDFPNIGRNPSNHKELIVLNKSGKSVAELTQLAGYEIKETNKDVYVSRGEDRRKINDRRIT